MHYLAFEIEQPAVLELLEYPETVAPSTIDFLCRELFRPEGYRRALATRLLRDVPDPPPKVVRLLAKQLSDAIELEQEELAQSTLIALAQYGERAEPALPLVEKILAQSQCLPEFPKTQLALDVLVACGPRGLPVVQRLLAEPAPVTTDMLVKILENMGENAQPLTPEVLKRIEHEGDRKSVV